MAETGRMEDRLTRAVPRSNGGRLSLRVGTDTPVPVARTGGLR